MKLLLLYVAFCILGGILGTKMRKNGKSLSWSAKAQTVLLIVLLVTMGSRVGANEEVVASIGSIGISAFILTVFCMLGSVAAVFLVRKLMKFDSKGVREDD